MRGQIADEAATIAGKEPIAPAIDHDNVGQEPLIEQAYADAANALGRASGHAFAGQSRFEFLVKPDLEPPSSTSAMPVGHPIGSAG